jgi:hypothetical protein
MAKTLKIPKSTSHAMRHVDEIARASLNGYVPKRKMKALIKRVAGNSGKRGGSGSPNDLNPAVILLYCSYRNEKGKK